MVDGPSFADHLDRHHRTGAVARPRPSTIRTCLGTEIARRKHDAEGDNKKSDYKHTTKIQDRDDRAVPLEAQ